MEAELLQALETRRLLRLKPEMKLLLDLLMYPQHCRRQRIQHSRVFEKTRLIQIAIEEVLRQVSEMERELGAAMTAAASLGATNADPATVQAITGAFQTLRVRNDLNTTSAGSISDLNQDLVTMAEENSVAFWTTLPSTASTQVQDRADLPAPRAYPPLISLEAVQMALRRIDHGDRAMKPSGSEGQASRESPSRRANLTKTGQATKKGPGVSGVPNKRAVVGPHIEYYVCRGNHFYYQKAECKEEYESWRNAPRGARGRAVAGDSKAPSPPAVAGSRSGRGGQRAGSALLSPLWAENAREVFTKMSFRMTESESTAAECMSDIVDGGASSTVIGLKCYVHLCEEQDVLCKVAELRPDDFRFHAFGTANNHSKLKDVVGRSTIPLPVGNGKFVLISALEVDGDVPFVIGKGKIREHGCLESHHADWIEFDTERGRVRIASFVSLHDGHSRIRMHYNDMLENVAEGMLQATTGMLGNGHDLIRRIHSRTHLHPKSVEALLKRANKWVPAMAAEIAEVQENFWVCLRSGDPPPARKFSLSRLDAKFNERVYVDVLYWDTEMIMHVVDYATGYSEMGLIEFRNMEQMLRTIQNIWILRHGDPVVLYADADFERRMVRKWAKDLRIKFDALPARLHNKAGCVERKNRAVKDALEKIDNDARFDSLPLFDRIAEATFVGNVLYGNRTASSFELARGYTPSISGSGSRLLPEGVLDAHVEMVARRLLAKVIRARPTAKNEQNISHGDNVLILLPGGKRRRGCWTERRVHEVREDGAVVVGTGRQRCVVAPEDVRTIPKNAMAEAAVRASLDVAPASAGSESDLGDDGNDGQVEEDELFFNTAHSSSDDDDSTGDFGGSDAVVADPNSVGMRSADDEDGGADHVHAREENNGEERPSSAEAPDATEEIVPATSNNGEVGALSDENGSDSDGAESSLEPPLPRSRAGRTLRPTRRFDLLANPISRDRTRQSTLAHVHNMVGTAQFMAHEMSYIPQWMYDEANVEEIEKNWLPNMVPTLVSEVPKNANVISSHMVYKVKKKEEEGGSFVFDLKARLCVHGNRDDESESLRTDAAVVSQNGFRLLYSAAVAEGLVVAKADIRGAYTQSGSARRAVFVQPPRGMKTDGHYWLLTATIYGLVSAGRKWQRASYAVMLHGLGLSPVVGTPQLFLRTAQYAPHLLVAKYVDDLVISARNAEWLQYGKDGVARAFELSAWDTAPAALMVNGTEVVQTDSALVLGMDDYVREIDVLRIVPRRRKQPDEAVSRLEIRQVKSLAGKLGYLGVTVSPFATFAASYIQQMVPVMTVNMLKRVNGIVRDVKRRVPIVSYLRPPTSDVQDAVIACFAGAGFPHHGTQRGVAQEGCVVGIAFGTAKGAVFHTLSSQSRKQRRVSTSSGEAETIAAVSALGCARAAQSAVAQIYGRHLPLVLIVDSKGLHRCLAKQSQPRNSGMHAGVHKLRMAYEAGDIDDLVWVPGVANPADALTKPHAGATADVLEWMLVEGRLPVAINNRRDYGPALEEEE